jgi:hypothetical protein
MVDIEVIPAHACSQQIYLLPVCGLLGFRDVAVQQWRSSPELEAGLFEDYGADPRENCLWNITLLREAVSTAALGFPGW